jgi:putative membrane protein
MKTLDQAGKDRVNAAVAEAERRTSGEIYCILAREVSQYREVPLAWAALVALVLPVFLIPFGFLPSEWAARFDDWSAAHQISAERTAATAILAYAGLQIVLFILTWALVAIAPVRRALTPPALKARRVRQAALKQFLAKGVHETRERTGVLIFASLADHWVEVIADEGIYGKVDPCVWRDAVKALTTELKAGRAADGFVAAVRIAGVVLAEHFPPRSDNPNELPDQLVIL